MKRLYHVHAEGAMRRLGMAACAGASVVIAVALAWKGTTAALSAGVGAAVAIASFAALCALVRRAYANAGGGRAGFLILMIIKQLGVAGLLWFVVTHTPVEPVALLVGLSVVPVSLIARAAHLS